MAAPDKRVSIAHRRSHRSSTTWVWSVGAKAKTCTASIAAAASDPMVVLTDTVDWTEMEMRAAKVREKSSRTRPGDRHIYGPRSGP